MNKYSNNWNFAVYVSRKCQCTSIGSECHRRKVRIYKFKTFPNSPTAINP